MRCNLRRSLPPFRSIQNCNHWASAAPPSGNPPEPPRSRSALDLSIINHWASAAPPRTSPWSLPAHAPLNHQSSIINSKGFTLLELIIVVILVAFILGLATLFFANTLPSARLSATGRELVATIRHLKAVAQKKSEDQVLVINLDTREYGIKGGEPKTIPKELTVIIEDPDAGTLETGTYNILFHATGGVDGGTIILQWRNRKISLQIDPVTGAQIL